MSSTVFTIKFSAIRCKKSPNFRGFLRCHLFRCNKLAKNAYFDTMHPSEFSEGAFLVVEELSFLIEVGCN